MGSRVTIISQISPPRAMSRSSPYIASEITRQTAKFEAAKVRQKFLLQEYEMERQRTSLDRDIKMIQCKRKMEEAQ